MRGEGPWLRALVRLEQGDKRGYYEEDILNRGDIYHILELD
jgi:hypothetical protein